MTRGKGGEAPFGDCTEDVGPQLPGHVPDVPGIIWGWVGGGEVGVEGGKRQPCPAAGKSTLAIVTFAKYEWFEEWKDEPVNKRGDAYEDLKKTFVDAVMEVVFKLYPNIEDKVRK